MHDYIPDFIIKLKTTPEAHLILETKGFDPLTEVKTHAAERWVTAVNADGTYGEWLYAICRKPEEVTKAITEATQTIAEGKTVKAE
jgi:type III restriction enzyme